MEYQRHLLDLATFVLVAVFYKVHDRRIKQNLTWTQQQHTKILMKLLEKIDDQEKG